MLFMLIYIMNKENIPKINCRKNKGNTLITSFFKPKIENSKKLNDITNIIKNTNYLINNEKEQVNLEKEEKLKHYTEDINKINENDSTKLNIDNLEEDLLDEISQNEINNIINEFSSPNKYLNKKRRKFHNIKTMREKKLFIKNKNPKKLNSKGNKIKISILSYNILNQIFMKKKNRPDLSLENRMEKIIKEIINLSPDIFCLQEADLHILKQYFHNKENNKFPDYSIYYGINCGSSFINIIGFKSNKFLLKSFKNFSLLFMGKNSGNRGIMFLQLECIENKKEISIYNVHFPWKYEIDKLTMLKLLFQHINDNNNIKSNVFIAGDFNAEPNSNIIKLFYYKKFQKEKNENENYNTNYVNVSYELMNLSHEIYNKFHLKSAYQNYSKNLKNVIGDYYFHPICTSRTHFYKRNIDYIFYSKKIHIDKILRLPSELEIDKEIFLPSKDFPSDHLKIFAQFTL